jgi:hypothetical protein
MKSITLLIFVALALSGASLAFSGTSSVTNNLEYYGGTSTPAYSGGTDVPFDTSADITHVTAFSVTVTQGGVDVSTFETGPAEVTVNLKTTSTLTDTLSASLTQYPSNTPQTNQVAMPLVYSDEYFNFMDSVYSTCLISYSGLEGIHVMNYPDVELPRGYSANYCNKALSNPTTINLKYKPYDTAAVSGLGKGYLYCQGHLFINGADAGAITSTDQNFAANTTIDISTMNSVPIQARYGCFFVSELYDSNGNKQVLQNILHEMPNGNPITPTYNVPIIRPPLLNLVPWIRLGTFNYTPTTPLIVRVPQNTKMNLTFIVVRNDTLTLIPTPNLTWTYTGTPPEISGPPTTYWYDPLTPPIFGGGPPYVLRPPTEITICPPGATTDTITLTVDPAYAGFPFGDIIERDEGDNTITITVICIRREELFCLFEHDLLVIAPGQSRTNIMSCLNNTGGYIDCPTIEDDEVSWGGSSFGTFFEVPTWGEITHNSQTADEFNVTAIENSGSDIAYSGYVSVDIIPDDSWINWNDCRFDLIWRRPDCRYYM